jgi:tetratricopeptide (TPR) repeat protein
MQTKAPSTWLLLKLKALAALHTGKMYMVLLGRANLIISAIVCAVLSLLFHLNAPICFVGCFVAITVAFACSKAARLVWKSNLSSLYQQERLWDRAEALFAADVDEAVSGIMQNKPPKEISVTLSLGLAQKVLLLSRQGESEESIKITEFIMEHTRDESEKRAHANTLAAQYVATGRYQDGIRLYQTLFVQEKAKGDEATSATIGPPVGLSEAYLDLHQFSDAERVLGQLKAEVDRLANKKHVDLADEMVRDASGGADTENSFYWLYLGKLKTATNAEDAESALQAAFDLANREHVRKCMTLLIPDVQYSMALRALKCGNLPRAIEYAKQAVHHYDEHTRYRGRDYWLVKALLTYATVKAGRTQGAAHQLNECREHLEKFLVPNHPAIATTLAYLGETLIADGDKENARPALERSLTIRRALYRPNDSDITDVEKLLASIAPVVTN